MQSHILLFLLLVISTYSYWDPKNGEKIGERCIQAEASLKLNPPGQLQPFFGSYSMLNDNQTQQMIQEKSYVDFNKQSILFASPHAAGLVLLLILLPSLMCCSCNPEKHPVCRSCRKTDEKPYDSCDLKWPALAALLCYLVIGAGAALGITKSSDIKTYVENTDCKFSSLPKSLYYGKTSNINQSQYFVGIKELSENFKQNQWRNLTYSFYSAGSSINWLVSNISYLKQQLKTSLQNASFSFSNPIYENAFRQNDGVTYVNISSAFKEKILGSLNETNKLIGYMADKIWPIFNQIQIIVKQFTEWNWNQLTQHYPEWRIQYNYLTPLSNQMQNSLENYYFSQLFTINKKDESNNSTSSNEEVNQLNYIDIAEKGIMGFYGAVAGFAFFGFIFSCTVCCQFSKTRKCMYFFCGFLALIMIIGFILLTVISFIIPNMTSTCIYMDSKMESEDGTNQLLLDLKYSDKSAKIFTHCLHNTSSTNILSYFNEQYFKIFQKEKKMAYYSNYTQQLFPLIQSSKIDEILTKQQNTFNQVRQGKLNQFEDQRSKTFFTNLAQKNFAVNSNCVNSSNIYADSWVPSHSSQIQCMSGTVERTPCFFLGNMTDCPTGCYQIYNQFNKSLGPESNLSARYGPPGCNYYDYLMDLKTNWLDKLDQSLRSYEQSDMYRLRNNLYSVKSYPLYLIPNSTNEILNLVNQYFPNLLNTEKGSLFHSDCKIVGEETQNIKTSVCGLLKTLEYHFIFLCMICYSTLLMMCFTVCAGVRNYKNERQTKVANNFGRQFVPNRSDSKIKVEYLEGSVVVFE